MSVQKKRTRDIATKRRVVLTGSECTGKTQIVQALAAHFDCPFSAEGARLYLDRQSMALTAQDIEPIACEQIAQEDAAVGRIGPAREQYAIAAVANYLAKGSITPSHDIDSP